MRAFITGINGQDGAYLANHLLELGYNVFGGMRRSSSSNTWRLDYFGIADRVKLVNFDLQDPHSVDSAIRSTRPDQIYNLAAQSFVGTSFQQPVSTFEQNASGVLHILEAIRRHAPEAKFYQASTSELFGLVQEVPQTEQTPFYPRSPYGVAKLAAHWATINYREAYGLHATTGILFNHESPLRGAEFVTRKIAIGLARLAVGGTRPIELGNLNAERDWGFAGDYVVGMRLICEHKQPGDFVLATGETHSVREYLFVCADELGFDPVASGAGLNEKIHDKKSGALLAFVNEKYYRPAEVDLLKGDPSKAIKTLGWKRSMSFDQLAREIASTDLRRVKAGVPLFDSAM